MWRFLKPHVFSDFNLMWCMGGGSFFKSIWCVFIHYNFKNIQTSTLLPTLVVNLVMAFFLLTLGSISWKGNTRTYLGFFTACILHLIFHEISRRHCGANMKINAKIRNARVESGFFGWICPIVQDAKFKLKGLPFHRYCNKYPKPFLMSKKSSNRQTLTC